MGKIGFILAILLLISWTGYSQAKKTPAYYFQRGEDALNKKEYMSALAHFNECLRLDNHYSEAYRLRAITREHLGDKDKALVDYNIYVSLIPTDVEALFSRAVLRFESDQYMLARLDFLNLLKLPPGETNTVYFSQEKYNDSNAKIFTAHSAGKDHLYNYLGLIETKLKRYDKAIEWLDSAIKVSSTNASYYINRGSARLNKNDKNGAIKDFDDALKLDPDNSLALHNLATLRSAAGENSSSEKLLTEAIEKNKDLPYPRSERAYLRLQRNDLAGALEDYDEVVRIEPLADENYFNRGLVKERMKDLTGALGDFTKAVSINDKNEKSWLSRGNVLSKLGRWDEAIEDYTVAISLASDYGLAYYNRAIANQSSGKLTYACSDLKVAEKYGVKADVKIREKICK